MRDVSASAHTIKTLRDWDWYHDVYNEVPH